MFTYYLDLAFRSLRRNVALTILMIVAIAFGVGASMTTLTVLHVLSADPIPAKSHQLYYVQLDARPVNSYKPDSEPELQMTRFDGEALYRAHKADRQLFMTGGEAPVDPQRAGMTPFYVDARWTTNDFFAMFEVPFLAGGVWSPSDDERAARVCVITRSLATKIFGSTEVVGKEIVVDSTHMQVVGVIEDYRPIPHFYDLNGDKYGKGEQLFVPWSTSRELKLQHAGSMDCWGDGGGDDNTSLNAQCEWTQYWVELATPEKAADFKQYLIQYSQEQKAAGRYQRPPNVALRDVLDWLDHQNVVPSDAKLQTYMALGFLIVCLVNTVGLLLTKFLRRSPEIGVRRALGASKRSIFAQLLIESGIVGLVGGGLGLGLAWLGLWGVRNQPTSYADLAHLDLPMLGATFGLAVASSILAGLLPAWRGCQVTPALQLKSH